MKDPREIRRKECWFCKGAGKIDPSPESKGCSKCKGKGWTRNLKGTESVCVSCNGDGIVVVNSGEPCSICDGQGYTVKVVAIREYRDTCEKCKGKGELSLNDCPICFGKAVVRSEDALDNWHIECPNCDGAGGFETEPHKCPDCLGSGVRSSVHEVNVKPRSK